MPALFFPNLDVLRLALASGSVPPDVARAPARVAVDGHARVWLEPAVALPRATLSALTRLGVQVLGGGGPAAPESLNSWAEVLPLRPLSAPDDRPVPVVLFEMPDGLVPRFHAALARRTRG